MASRKPNLYIFGGSNGAGKTTFAKEFLRKHARSVRFINADEMARGLSPLNPDMVAVKAGRLLLREVHESIAARESFALESTLSGKTCVRLLRGARADGFQVELHYLSTSSAGTNRRTSAPRRARYSEVGCAATFSAKLGESDSQLLAAR